MKLSRIYSEFFTNWLTDGFFINRSKISSVGIKPGFDRIFTKGYVRKIWIIEKIPVRYDDDICDVIRDAMFASHPNCETFISTVNNKTYIELGKAFNNQMSRAEEAYRVYEKYYNDLTNTEKAVGKRVNLSVSKKITISKSQLDKYKDTYDSYYYTHEHLKSEGQMVKTTIIVEALCPDDKSMKSYKKKLHSLLVNNGIDFRDVRGNVSKVLTNYGFSSYIQKGSKQQGILSSDEGLAGCMPYRTKGLVGGKGILMGVDQRNKQPFILDFFSSGAGQIIMLLAQTGKGKTYTAYQICLGLITENVHCSTIDIKGGEWEKLRPYTPLTVVDMSSTSPRFVNTMRLDDVPVTRGTSEMYYRMAVEGTVNALSIMTNLQKGEGNIVDLESVLNQAVEKVYSKRNVDPKVPDSFKKTKDIKYDEIIPAVNELSLSKAYTDEQKKMCKLIQSRCSDYLQAEGKYANAFKHEITLGEVLKSPLVIYSFGKNSGEMLDSMDNLRVFMCQYLDTKKQAIRKAHKLHTAAFYEELQRCGEFGRLVTHIRHNVTGSRSNNVIIFLLLNDMSVLNQPEFLGIRSNITTKIIGHVDKKDMLTLCESYSCEDIATELTVIREDPDFANCFAIKYDTGNERGKTVFKVELPKDVIADFKTRDDKEN